MDQANYQTATIYVGRSLWKQLAAFAANFMLCGGAIWLALHDQLEINIALFAGFIWIKAIFFGCFALIALLRLLSHEQNLIELNNHGIIIKRASRQSIAWTDIEEITLYPRGLISLIRIKLNKHAFAQLHLTFDAKIASWANKSFGPNIICISNAELNMPAQELLRLISTYHQKYRLPRG